MELQIPLVDDFEVNGQGSHQAWSSAAWQTLTRVGAGGANYPTKAKVVYSVTGIYFLFECEDRVLTCTHSQDMADLFAEDVVEVFLWPDESEHVYFEYELSPLNYELPIMVTNSKGRFYGWLPWHYTGSRRTRHATHIKNGEKKSKAAVLGYSTEFFIPFELLSGTGNNPPTPGTRWRANMYRIDYDNKPESHWAWNPATGAKFHNLTGFGTFVFGEKV